MTSIFIDSSVLFAACKSKSGASAGILKLCRQRKVDGHISKYVEYEMKKNALNKLSQIEKERLNFFLLQTHLLFIAGPTEREINDCRKVINIKDAPILAGAIKSKASHLITLNTRDFMHAKINDFVRPMIISTPGDFIFEFNKKSK